MRALITGARRTAEELGRAFRGVPVLTSGGSSARSGSLRAGRMNFLIPCRRAASTFSRMPPTGSTRPLSVISPVIATSSRTG